MLKNDSGQREFFNKPRSLRTEESEKCRLENSGHFWEKSMDVPLGKRWFFDKIQLFI